MKVLLCPFLWLFAWFMWLHAKTNDLFAWLCPKSWTFMQGIFVDIAADDWDGFMGIEWCRKWGGGHVRGWPRK